MTFTGSLGGLSKPSNEKPELVLSVTSGGAGWELAGMGMSSSSEISGKAEAAASKSMSSVAPVDRKSLMAVTVVVGLVQLEAWYQPVTPWSR